MDTPNSTPPTPPPSDAASNPPVPPAASTVPAPAAPSDPAPSSPPMDASEKPLSETPPSGGKNKLLLIIVVVVVSLIVFVGIGWYFMVQQSQQTAMTPTPSPMAAVSPTPAIDPMSEWQTYVSSESGFMIKHPSQVNVTVHQETGFITVFTLVGSTQQQNTEFYDGISLQLSSGELGSSTLEAFVKEKAAGIEEHAELTKPVSPITVSGINGFTFSASGVGDITYIYLPDGGAYLQIVDATADPTNKGYAKIVSDMLATLTFTQEETTTPASAQ